MSEGKLMVYGLGFLLIVGLVTPYLLGFFIDVSAIDTGDSLIDPVVTLVDEGVTLFGLTVNPFSILFGLKDYLVESLIFFSLLPDFIIAIVMILVLLSVFYALIKAAPTT